MWLPKVILALICVGFGVFATNYVIPKTFIPIAGDFQYVGAWNSTTIFHCLYYNNSKSTERTENRLRGTEAHGERKGR